ncbi:MAG: 16S rRNA (guanine(966)-N(2))-methyltransferase RsmD [Polyangiaceae bacterium]|nr:16S rRNA (guanine(966)-N(2))-methyltransferase RsmD [Polyangiaceae bacterium]
MRIIGGRLGGRRLEAPRGEGTRPTSDKVREALFSVLGDVAGLRVLDLYAGTGALALEALSRGAAAAVCVESGRLALAALRGNARALALTPVVVPRPVERAAGDVAVHGPFDLAFVDPPYALVDSGALAEALARYTTALAEGALVVVEHAARSAAPEIVGLARDETRTWGDTSITFFTRSAS